VVPEEDWVVVSFHTVPEDELIEERPDPDDRALTRRKVYLAYDSGYLRGILGPDCAQPTSQIDQGD
jgi:hypothetical protein